MELKARVTDELNKTHEKRSKLRTCMDKLDLLTQEVPKDTLNQVIDEKKLDSYAETLTKEVEDILNE